MNNKIKAHMGDSLINFFARELMANDDSFHRNDQISQANRMTSNNFLINVCIKHGISEPSGTNYEASVYEIYLENGLNAAYEYFKKTAYALWKEKVSEGKINLIRPNHVSLRINSQNQT